MHSLREAMKNVIAGELHVVVAEREDQIVGVMWTRHPEQHLSNLARATQLGRVEVRPSPHAPQIVASLEKRFDAAIDVRGASAFWTLADFEEVIDALGEYDLARGILAERAGLKSGDPVYVTNIGRGVVKSFTMCGRVVVEFDRPHKNSRVGAIAPRSAVKPILRPGAPT